MRRGRYERLSIEPLRKLIRTRMAVDNISGPDFAAGLGVSFRTLQRVLYQDDFCSISRADRWATRLGYNYLELWPEARQLPDRLLVDDLAIA